MIDFNDDIEKLVEQYFSGVLSESDKTLFEKELETNVNLKKAYLSEKAVVETVFAGKMAGLSSMIDADFDNVYQAKRSWKNKGLLGLGLLLLVSGISYWGINKKEVASDKQSVVKIKKYQTNIIEKQEVVSKAIEGGGKEKTLVDSEGKEFQESAKTKEQELEKIIQDSIVTKVDKNESLSLTSDDGAITSIDEPKKNIDDKISSVFKPICPPSIQQLDYKVVSANLGETYGRIDLARHKYGFSGNYKAFLYQLEFEEELDDFTEVEKGLYKIVLKGENGCQVTSKDTAYVNSSGCSKESQSVFNPENGTWELAIATDREAIVEVRTKLKTVYKYSSEIGDSQIIWEGLYDNGETAALGLHFYELKYSDGEICRGSIMIAK